MKKIFFGAMILLLSSYCLSESITLDSLIQILETTQKNPEKSRLTYVEKRNDYREPKLKKIDPDMSPEKVLWIENQNKIKKINQSTIIRKSVNTDKSSQKKRIIVEDLRDLEAIVQKHEIHEKNFMNLSKNFSQIFDGHYEMLYSATANNVHLNSTPNLVPYSPLTFHHSQKFYLLGKNFKTHKLVEIEENGKVLLKLELSGDNIKGILHFDPEFGYNLRRWESYSNGILRSRVIADDFIIQDGIIIPRLYKRNIYDENGKLIKDYEHKIEEIKTNVTFSKEDFEIFIPAGTSLTNTITNDLRDIERPGNYSPASLIKISAERITNEFIAESIGSFDVNLEEHDVSEKQNTPISNISEEKVKVTQNDLPKSSTNSPTKSDGKYRKSFWVILFVVLLSVIIVLARKRGYDEKN